MFSTSRFFTKSLIAFLPLATSSEELNEEKSSSVWGMLLLLCLLMGLWLWLRQWSPPSQEPAAMPLPPSRPFRSSQPAPIPDTETATPVTAVAPTPPPAPPAQPDDLRQIEGIGPKIATLLQSAGITTFQQLAAMEPTAIKKLLTEAGLRLGDPTTWPEQAKLAAEGNLEALKTLQNSLKGGRRA